MGFFKVMPYAGELFAFITAVCWTITALVFEFTGKRVGSLPVNFLRLFIALLFFSTYGLGMRGMIVPSDASTFTWTWMSISGLVGFCFGDLCLFQAFVMVGSRISSLMMSAVPLMTTLIGWWLLNERLEPLAWVGMALTIGGIVMVVNKRHTMTRTAEKNMQKSLTKGVIFAFCGAAGQAIGLVISKYGMKSYDAGAATHIRVIAGTIGFALLFTFSGQWPKVKKALADKKAVFFITLGALFGPFLGVTFSLLAVQHTETGIASTIMAIVPILIIPPSIVLFKEKLTAIDVIGATISVIGVSLLFL
ncbi:MAG: DMT family transporter [bacterium]